MASEIEIRDGGTALDRGDYRTPGRDHMVFGRATVEVIREAGSTRDKARIRGTVRGFPGLVWVECEVISCTYSHRNEGWSITCEHKGPDGSYAPRGFAGTGWFPHANVRNFRAL